MLPERELLCKLRFAGATNTRTDCGKKVPGILAISAILVGPDDLDDSGRGIFRWFCLQHFRVVLAVVFSGGFVCSIFGVVRHMDSVAAWFCGNIIIDDF